MKAIAATSPKAKAVSKVTRWPCPLGQHGALLKAAFAIHASDSLLAFLDDLYVLITERARAARDTVPAVSGGAANEDREGTVTPAPAAS